MQEKRAFWRNFSDWALREIARTLCFVTLIVGLAIAAGGI